MIADFTNMTSDPVFDGALRQGLAVQLEQSPFLSLVSDERIQRTLGLMGQPPDAQLTPMVAREVCERIASAAVVEGSIASLGSQYVLGLRAIDCGTGSVLADEQGQAARKEDVLNVLSQMASKLRSRVGESLATVEKHDTPLEDATTSSLEALKAYSTARKVKFLPAGYASAVPLLKHAIEIDPNFAMAYAFLGRTYGDIGEFALSAENTNKAYQLRNHTSERERFFIDVTYHRQVTGNLEKAHQTLELWAETYPRDTGAHGLLSGFTSQGSGKYQEAIEEGKKAIGLDPDFVPGVCQCRQRLSLSRPASRKRSKCFSKLPNANWKFQTTYSSAITSRFLRATRRAWNVRRPWERHILGRKTGCCTPSPSPRRVPGSSSGPGECRAAPWIWPSRQASGKGRLSLKPELPCGKRSSGTCPLRGEKASEALELSKGRDAEYGAAFALALANDSSRSQALANDLENRFPEDTSVQFSYLPTLRALFALNRGEPSHAIELLQIAAPYELAVPGIDYYFFFGGLYPAYVRGEAYLAAHQGAEAAAEFQKILDHPGIVLSDPDWRPRSSRLGTRLRFAGRHGQGQGGVSRFPNSMERR